MWNERTLVFPSGWASSFVCAVPTGPQTKGCLTSSGSQVSLGLQAVADGGNPRWHDVKEIHRMIAELAISRR